MMAKDEGFNTIIVVQEYRYASTGPKPSIRYGYSPPDLGIIVPSSAKQRAPAHTNVLSFVFFSVHMEFSEYITKRVSIKLKRISLSWEFS